MAMPTIHIHGAAAVLAGGVATGEGALARAAMLLHPGEAGNELDGFDPKPYVSTVKGYLDGAAKYALAAASLALGERREQLPERREAVGVVSASRWGAPESGFRFLQQLASKGPRHASPLVFPHSYPNTAGNLVAMEFRFAGPHVVYLGPEGAREALHCAAAILERRQASHILLVVCEAAIPQALPEEIHPVNGAIALWLSADPADALDSIHVPDTSAKPSPNGAVADLLATLNPTESP